MARHLCRRFAESKGNGNMKLKITGLVEERAQALASILKVYESMLESSLFGLEKAQKTKLYQLAQDQLSKLRKQVKQPVNPHEETGQIHKNVCLAIAVAIPLVFVSSCSGSAADKKETTIGDVMRHTEKYLMEDEHYPYIPDLDLGPQFFGMINAVNGGTVKDRQTDKPLFNVYQFADKDAAKRFDPRLGAYKCVAKGYFLFCGIEIGFPVEEVKSLIEDF